MDWVASHWMQIGLIAVLAQNFLKGVRDSIDKTPQTDDNKFERFVTISGKVVSYFFAGARPK